MSSTFVSFASTREKGVIRAADRKGVVVIVATTANTATEFAHTFIALPCSNPLGVSVCFSLTLFKNRRSAFHLRT